MSTRIDLRAAVLDALQVQGRSRCWLADHDTMSCGRDAVLRWLAGKSELSAVHVGECLTALGLALAPSRVGAAGR